MCWTIRRATSKGDEMRRGDLYRVRKHSDPKPYRIFVVVSRNALIESRFSTVVCAPVYSVGGDLSTQVSLGPAGGLKHATWIFSDNLISVRKSDLTDCIGSLPRSKISELNSALKMALDLS
jgi:mRNA interferase MazF